MARYIEGIDRYRSGRLSCLEAAEFLGISERHFRRLRDVYEAQGAKGLFCSFYTDRGSHYFTTIKAGEEVDRTRLTQVGRALGELGIEHIASYCPEGRGRMERLWGTLQQRLPPVFRTQGITTIEAANRYLAQTYIAQHNARFAVRAEEEGTAFTPFVGDLSEILCAKYERQVGNDNCVRFEKLSLQIPEQRHRRHFVRAQVQVRRYGDETLAVFHGPRRLARYAADGTLTEEETFTKSAA